MKKIYAKPSMTTIVVEAENILAGSDITYSGSNAGLGIITADSKIFDIINDDEEE